MMASKVNEQLYGEPGAQWEATPILHLSMHEVMQHIKGRLGNSMKADTI